MVWQKGKRSAKKPPARKPAAAEKPAARSRPTRPHPQRKRQKRNSGRGPDDPVSDATVRLERGFPSTSRTHAREDDAPGVTSSSPLPPEPLRGPGRPTVRTPEIEDHLLDWLSCGGPLRAFCRLPGMPSHTQVHEWRRRDKAFAARYLAAKRIGYDELAEQCLEIADTPLLGETREEGEGGGDGENGGGSWSKVRREDMLGHRKLQIWARLQLLAKWFPKKYGNKLDVEATGTMTFDDKLRQALGLAQAETKPQDHEDG